MGHQVVGVFVANREACGGDEVARIRSEFEVEDFISYDRHRPRNQAMLTALALNPIFAGHCRFALKEVLVGLFVCPLSVVRCTLFVAWCVRPAVCGDANNVVAGRQPVFARVGGRLPMWLLSISDRSCVVIWLALMVSCRQVCLAVGFSHSNRLVGTPASSGQPSGSMSRSLRSRTILFHS